ncbi:hypothetical protein N7478_005206 [Penicillium angulare]|uniref:uncharacterized protein n=1 Tax=Penicillium angulare TaxID=116970 RepID=UPI002540C859|nr:uncharacterized protein N7478_005206 [Penicillium angulare]KAJ5279834.1 hypothetical protein N7478_005206 [Penicillium angulare]
MSTSKSTRVVILGAGTQGRRLAYMWSSEGGPVTLVDLQEKQLRDGLDYVQQLREAKPDEADHWGEIEIARPDSLAASLQNSWLVIEVIAELDDLAPLNTIIASNSSSYGIAEILDGLSLKNQTRRRDIVADKVDQILSDWPPETSAIEIMGHEKTDPPILAHLLESCKAHGFSPFHVKKSSIGYIYNRIWAAIKRETLLTLSEGVCTPEEIDSIFKNVLKTPKGPCEQMDVVGLDVVLDIENHYAESRDGLPTEPREYLKRFIQNGELGVKSGKGFYNYDSL